MKRRSDYDDVYAKVLDFSEEWKSPFPVNSVYKAPRLLTSPSTLGPLCFNRLSDTVTPLLSSKYLSPISEITEAQRLSLSRFVSTSANPKLFLPPTLACSISNSATHDDYRLDGKFELKDNRLQLLHCPGEESAVVFFPFGENFDQVGFVHLIVKAGKLSACGVGDPDGVAPFVGKKKLNHKIVKMLVNPVEDSTAVGSENDETCIGNLMVSTLYSVHWFVVKLRAIGTVSEKPCLSYLGGKQFKSSSIADAAWSPHMPEESVVLLKSGELFLFDLNNIFLNTSRNFEPKGKRYTKLCEEKPSVSEKYGWFGCEFSWHPRILVAGHQNEVSLIDLRFEKPSVSCLAKLGLKKSLMEKNLFIALAKAGLDGFHFVVASNCLLALFDIRQPHMPVLQWNHNLEEPTYVDVHRLSDLRSGLRDGSYDWATETGFCIILGSFWHNEFSVFCFGPSEPASKESFNSKISEVSSSMYAWELPSEIMLAGTDCVCGTCLISNEFLKDALPKWVPLQQKKEITLGFRIISSNMSSLLSEPHENGGFTLVRLLSSGKLESERYCASSKFSNELGKAHRACLKHVEKNLLSSGHQDRYKFPRRFKYLKLDYLNEYLNGGINSHLILNRKTPLGTRRETQFRDTDCYKIVREKLNTFGFGMPKSITDVLEDASFPTSVHEMAFRRMWTAVPMNLLQLAFSNYPELLEVRLDKRISSLEFLPVPQEPQLAPFFGRKCSSRSNKWSSKVKRSNNIVGPLLPLPVLVSLQKAQTIVHANQSEQSSYESELDSQCCQVKKAAKHMANTILSDDNPDTTLDNDKEDTPVCSATPLVPSTRPFLMYTCGPVSKELPISINSSEQDDFESKGDSHTTYISKVSKNDSDVDLKDSEQEIFSDICPVELKFKGKVVVGNENRRSFSLLKRQFSKWLAGVDSYQEFCRSPKYRKKG